MPLQRETLGSQRGLLTDALHSQPHLRLKFAGLDPPGELGTVPEDSARATRDENRSCSRTAAALSAESETWAYSSIDRREVA